MKIKILTGTMLVAIGAFAATRFVTVDDTQPMPWTDIAEDSQYWSTYPASQNVNMGGQSITNATNVSAYSVTMTGGNLDGGGNNLTNVGTITTTNLQIVGGSPTNGAVWIATNTAGQGTWVAPSYVFASRTNNMVISNATITDITFNSEKVDLLSEFDGTTFTASMDGIYAVTGAVSWYTLVATKRYSLYIHAASNFYYYEYMPGANMTQMHQAFSEQIKLLQGQTVVIKVQQDTGGDENILGSAGAHTRLQIARVVDL